MATDRAEENRKERRHILVIDDEPLVLRVAMLMLTRLGHAAHGAAGGGEALKILSARPGQIDLVIMDLLMPGVSGRELIERIAALEPELSLVLASGSAAEESSERQCPTVRGWLAKPFQLEELRRAVDQYAA